MRGGGPGGMFDRHRGPDDDAPWPAEPGMGRGRGRGFERSLSSGGGPGGPGRHLSGGDGAPPPGEDALLNGSVSPRKGYTRAPFADWRKSAAVTNEDEWRSTGAPSGRRWNQVGASSSMALNFTHNTNGARASSEVMSLTGRLEEWRPG